MANNVLYGVMSRKDKAAELTAQSLVAEIDRDLLIATTLETVAQHNEEMNALRRLFAGDTLDYQKNFRGTLTNELQESDEYGRAEPVKGHAFYTTGFPLRIARTAWGATHVSREQMTLEDFSEKTDQMLIGDLNWNRKWILGTLLFDGLSGTGPGTSPYVFADDEYGNINVHGLANGDAVTYDKISTAAPATDNHYTAQNGAISDTAGQNPFPTIETALLEHPSNTGRVVSFIAPGLETTVKALADFVPSDTFSIATPGDQTPRLIATGPNLPLPPSAYVIGSVGRVWVVVWRSVPANLIISRTEGQAAPALLFRQFPQVTLQGFGPVDYRRGNFGNRFPYFDEQWFRAGGYGGWNRTAAQVHQIGSSTTFSMPAAYYPLFGRTS